MAGVETKRATIDRLEEEIIGEQEGKVSGPTVAVYRRVFRMLRGIPGVTHAGNLTPETLDAFGAAISGKKSTTRIGLLRHFRAICNRAVARGYIDRSPFEARPGMAMEAASTGTTPYSGMRLDPRWFSIIMRELESRKHIAAVHRLYCLAAMVAYTGLLRMKACAARRSALDLAAGTVRIPHGRGSAAPAFSRPVPMPSELIALLSEWISRIPDEEYLFPNLKGPGHWTGNENVYSSPHRLQSIGEVVGFERLTINSFRRFHKEYVAPVLAKVGPGGSVGFGPRFHKEYVAPVLAKVGPGGSVGFGPTGKVEASTGKRRPDPIPWRGTREELDREIQAIHSEAARNVVRTLIDLMPNRPTKRALETKSGRGDAVNHLRRYADSGAKLGRAIGFPGQGKPGTWIVVEIIPGRIA